VGDGNKWKDGTSEKAIYIGWVLVKGLKCEKYELWNILWEWGLYSSENIQRKGLGFHVLGMWFGDVWWKPCKDCVIVESWSWLVILLWLLNLVFWSF
jgi:hypothetical protein